MAFNSTYGGFSVNVSGSISGLAARVTALEDAPIKSTYFQVVEATTGTITPPSGATILLDQFASSVDALVSEIDANGHPTFQTPQTAGGTYIAATLDASGNYTLTGTPASAEVAIIYVYSIARKNFDISESIGFEETNLFTNSDKQVITSAWVNGGNTFGAAATIGTNDAFDLTIKAHGSDKLSFTTNQANFTNISTVNFTSSPIISSSGTINLQVPGGLTANNGIIISKSTAITANSSDSNMLRVQGTFNPSSGSGTFTAVNIVATYNQTGTSSGTIRGIYYNPTITAILGTHYAFESTSGDLLVGGSGRYMVNDGGVPRVALDVNVGTSLRLGQSFNILSISPAIVNFNGGATTFNVNNSTTLVISTGGGSSASVGTRFERSSALTNASLDTSIITIGNTSFSPSSGSGSVSWLRINPTINQTGSASGTVRGIYYNPTLTSILGTHYAFESTAGNVLIGGGGTLQASGYKSSDGSDGVSGTWTTTDGKTITAKDGLITSIV